MIDRKTLRDWFVILMLLLFLPEENRLMVFGTKPADWYGELQIPLNGETLIIAKNARDKSVDLGMIDLKEAFALQVGQNHGISVGDIRRGPPESIIVMRVARAGTDTGRRALFSDDYYFEPGPLSVLTEADFYYGYLLVAILIGGFMILGFAIARYGVEENSEAEDK